MDKVASRFPDPLAVSLYEEFIFRALMFSSLVTLTPDRRVLLGVSSLIFCLAHFPSDIATFVSYFVGGLVYGYAFLKFQSLWVPVGIHFAWNFFQGQVFGFPVSGIPSYGLLSTSIAPDAYLNGGEIGPEGSMVGVLARLIILSWLFLSPAMQENDSFLIFKRKP
ncbi:CPBP family intramembrane glutamic endopeptidase [Negadavirga shengliensis]|uniref:CPBP family intramembrane glutamic endopeptidase n=1 Tax=Negadavirga shengliensis TaxID=1389218 RepID=A0ABV9SVB0_9BACT